MGNLKRTIDPTATGFEPYAGPKPRDGVYRARVVKVAIRKAKNTESLAYNVLLELKATKAEHKQYDGYTTFGQLWMGESEFQIARETSFVKAVTGKTPKSVGDVTVVYEGSEDEFAKPSGAKVTKIDGINPDGKFVNVELRTEKEDEDSDFDPRQEVNAIFAIRADAEPAAEEEVEVEEDEEAEEVAEGEITEEERTAELEALKLVELRAVAKELDINPAGVKKADLIAAILDAEFGALTEEDEEADEDEEIEEDDVEVEDEIEDEEEDEEEEEDEDEDTAISEEEELRIELADLDRTALKRRIKDGGILFTVRKSHTDDDLRDAIVDAELAVTPF